MNYRDNQFCWIFRKFVPDIIISLGTADVIVTSNADIIYHVRIKYSTMFFQVTLEN